MTALRQAPPQSRLCGYPELLRTRLRILLPGRSGRPEAALLLRNGHLLTLSSILTASLGAVFWLFATSWYSTRDVGLAYAVISAATLLAGLGQLNLADVLIRFLPAAGPHARRLVLRCYAAAVLASVLAGVLFLVLVPRLIPSLSYLRDWAPAAAFLAGTAGYALFVVQDGALTGLRRPGWVLAENGLFAVVKTLLMVACGLLALSAGILLSWIGALAVSLAVTTAYLLGRALPQHQRRRPADPAPDGLLRYAAADYVGFLFRLAAYNLVPLLVLDYLGPEQNAYFSLSWVIAYTLFLAAYNMGSSLIVEAARAPEKLAEHARTVLRHSGLLIAAGAAVLIVLAPRLLSLFGPGYAAEGTTTVRLLALAALPNLVLDVAVDVARARRRLGWAVGLQAALCALVLGLGMTLMPHLGLTGIALAWLLAETALALPLLLTLPRWLPQRRPS
ncbi:lipopolysaccharide biosynthesis protein [Kitasatospora nipponensis]|uniref:Lipopolysaccharide biosynthesis protein n=1 Tax=Kitasatospora nipponensis TaxID=258049 RepID=A0ABP4GRL8_9ACTN